MTSIRFEHRHMDVACRLDKADAAARAQEWHQLRTESGLGAERIPDGARVWLRADCWAAAEDLARREGACCGFLDLDLAVQEDRIRLEITSPAPGVATLIGCLAGLDDSCDLPCC